MRTPLLNRPKKRQIKEEHPLKCLKKRVWSPREPTKDLLKRRKAIEVGHCEAWITLGKGTFHFENLSILRRAASWFFRMLRLLKLGERNALDLQVNHLQLAFDNLPPAFDGYRILHLSDLHIDGVAGLTEAICGKIQDLEYDLCLLSGDYRFEIYGPFHNVSHYMGMLTDAIEAPDGTIAILGNHDFYEVSGILEGMGVQMLINQAMPIERGGERIWMIGLDDPHYYGCDDLPGAMQGIPDSAFKVLAVHTPELYDEATEAGIDLYLCGHTHGGQIRLPFLGPILLNADCPRSFGRGFWQHKGMKGYTHPGTGCSMVPVRFNCPPEIGLIELKRR